MTDKMTDYEKAINYYNNVRKSQEKYFQTENGKLKRREASKNYYENKKINDPTFLKRMSDKAKERYILKKERLLNIELPNIL